MTYNVRIMETAQEDFYGIYRYINDELKSPDAAKRRIKVIEEAVRSLSEMPFRVSLVADGYLASKGFRMLAVKTHLVFFIIREETRSVSVVRVLYNRRDWARILKIND